MKCNDFELQITAYIEGEIKEKDRKLFFKHKDDCTNCNQLLNDIVNLSNSMSQITKYNTSSGFMENLKNEIYKIDNKEPSFLEKIKNYKPFGYSPIPSFGFVLSFSFLIIATYFLFNNDKIPKIDMNKISAQPENNPFNLMISPQKQTVMADSDSTEENNNLKRYDGKIKLVKGN